MQNTDKRNWKIIYSKFEGMEKVYFPSSLDEALKTGRKIYSSGYSGKLLLQERLGAPEGVEAESSVFTTYSDRSGRVKAAVLGDVLLEEQGPTSRGNYSAIITKPLDEISYKLINMLDGIGYTGVANFDILCLGEKRYCLELNPRQGRSFDYIRSAGISLAELFVKDMMEENIEECFGCKEGLWRVVSKRTMIKYSKNKSLLRKGLYLEKGGDVVTPYDFSGERNPARKLYVLAHLYREKKRYAEMQT